jgi:nicotinamidase-related amidase
MKIQSSFLALTFLFVGFTASHALAKVDTATTAVVIVDMQEGFYERGGVTDTPGLLSLVTKQMELLNWAVAQNVPVLIFEYDGFGATDPRLTGILKGFETKSITKFDDNGFTSPSRKPAVAYLKSLNIKTLIMAGINGAYCVHDTTTGAISAGFDVVTASDIVGNLNQNPPIYPNNTWYFKNNKLEILPNLNAILY